MKRQLFRNRNAFLFLTIALLAQTGAFAQGDPGTSDDNFILEIAQPASIHQLLYNKFDDCGWVGSSYGPSITEEFCGELVWAEPDSLACNNLTPGSLTGKIAYVRRGTCDFSAKVFNCQKAGAIAVVIVNHYNNNALGDGPCETHVPSGQYLGGMSGVLNADSVTIPSVYIQRYTGEQITAALAAGETVEICFKFPRTGRAMAANHNLTPVSQVDTMYYMGMQIINRGSTAIDNLVVTADIKGPNGYTHSFSTPINASIAPGLDTFVYIDNYLPPAVIGQYDVTYSTNVFNESRDTLHRSFWITPYTFGADNAGLQLDGGADRNDLFVSGGFVYQIGNLILSGPNGGSGTYATFGIANIDSVYVPDNVVNVIVYDADNDGDGTINMDADWTDLSDAIVGIGIYTMTGTETEGTLLDVAIDDYLNPGTPVQLAPSHPYYISLLYDGTFEGSGRNCAFTNTSWSDYLNFPTTPMYLGQFYNGGWSDRTVISRLNLDGYVPGTSVKPNVLDASKFSVTPNPGNTYVNLNLDLGTTNEKVGVTLVSAQGKLIRQQTLRNFQSGVVRFDVADVPTGSYLMLIHTGEGHAVAKVTVCH